MEEGEEGGGLGLGRSIKNGNGNTNKNTERERTGRVSDHGHRENDGDEAQEDRQSTTDEHCLADDRRAIFSFGHGSEEGERKISQDNY